MVPAVEPVRFDTLGLGLTIDNGEADVLISTGTPDNPVFVVLTPEVAAQIGATMVALSTEATVLQAQISQMTPEELQEYLTEVQRRNSRGLN